MGNLLSIVVHKADKHDMKMGIWAAGLACKYFDVWVEITGKIEAKRFEVITPRWIVERTFAWLGNSRWLSKDYEVTTSSAETIVKISHIHTLLKRL